MDCNLSDTERSNGKRCRSFDCVGCRNFKDNPKTMDFKVGDKVIVELEVLDIDGNECLTRLTTEHIHNEYGFWVPADNLKLIERPKKKVKKWKVVYESFGEKYLSTNHYETREEFEKYCMDNGMQDHFVCFVKELEIEVGE